MPDPLEIDRLSVGYGRRRALHDVSLSIPIRGQVVGLFGQNGAGKSTLLRSLSGIVNRHNGTIRLPPGGAAYLPDSPFLYPWLRLDECVRLANRLWTDFDPGTAHGLFVDLGLRPSMRLRQASKGMLEQIHLGLVLARRSDLYLFDEPLAAVDPLTRDRLLGLIGSSRKPGSTVIISTHLIAGLEQLFDEAVVLHDGRVVLHDEVAAIASHGGLESRVKAVIA